MAPSYSYKNSLKSDASDELVNIYLQRPLAGLITFAVFPTRITPNHLTILAIAFGLAGGVLLALPTAHLTIAAGCFYLKDILDSADGQLARAKQLYSRRGRFLDSIGDFVVNLAVFGGIVFFLVRSDISPVLSFLVGIIGFLGVSLRVSYHVFYQTSFLHGNGEYKTNRVIEEILPKDLREDTVTLRLQRMFVFLYGWQDRMMMRIDRWCAGGEPVLTRDDWYRNRIGVRLSGAMGIGTEYVILTICLLLHEMRLYLALTIVVLNAVWLMSIFYRKVVLSKRITME